MKDRSLYVGLLEGVCIGLSRVIPRTALENVRQDFEVQ